MMWQHQDVHGSAHALDQSPDTRCLLIAGHDDARAVWEHVVDDERSVVGVPGEQHALRRFAAEFTWLKIGDDDDLPVDECFGFVMPADASANLTRLAGDVQLQDEQAIRIRVQACGRYRRNAKVQPGEIVERNRGFVGIRLLGHRVFPSPAMLV